LPPFSGRTVGHVADKSQLIVQLRTDMG